MPEDFDELKDYFLDVLKLATASKPLVVILDSLDQLTTEHNSHKLNWLPRKLPPNVRFLVSTYTEASGLIDTLRLVFHGHTFVNVPVFSQELSSQVLVSWLKNQNRKLTDEQFSIIEDAFKKCSLPLYVKLTYDQVLLWRSYVSLNQYQLSYTVQQSIEMLFSQLEKKHGITMVTRSLSYVTASASGISETELEDLLSLDDSVLRDVFQIHIPPLRRIPPLLWVRVRHDIAQYLVDKEVDEVRSFFWYHRQFFETAKKRYLSNKAYKQEIHSLMSDYYLGKWHQVKKPFEYTPEQMKRIGATSPNDEADRKVSAQPLIFSLQEDGVVRYNKRKLNKLPYHLYRANRVQELRTVCLFNYEWLCTKIKAVSLQEVLLDYALFGEKDGILHKALKAARSTLKLFPDTISLEISGRLLALLQVKTESYETKLLEDSIKASADTCSLVPYVPCYSIPSESELYTIENARVPYNAQISDISSDSSHFASLTDDSSVIIWDVSSGEQDMVVHLLDPTESKLNILKKPEGKDVVIIGCTHQENNNPIFVVNLNSGEVEQSLMLEKQYKKLVFHDHVHLGISEKQLLFLSINQSADVFDLKTGKLLHEFDGLPDQAFFVAMETMIVLHMQKSKSYNIYNADTFEHVGDIECEDVPKGLYLNQEMTVGCVMMENCPHLAMICLEKGDKLGKCLGKVDISTMMDSKIQKVILQNGNGLVVSLTGFLLFDMKSFKKVKEFRVPNEFKPTYRVLDFEATLSKDNAVVFAGYDKFLLIWDTKSGKLLSSVEATRSRISRLKLAPNNKTVVQTNVRNNEITAWSVELLKKTVSSYKPLALKNSARYMCLNREGTVAILRSVNSNEFAVIDILLGTIRCEISKEYEAMRPSITEDGRYAVIREYVSEDCLKFWDTQNGALVISVPVSSLYLKACVLGTQAENMVIVTENDVQKQSILTFYHIPTIKETGVSIVLGKFNMWQVVFAMKDKYLVIAVEKNSEEGMEIYTSIYEVATGKEMMKFPKMHPKNVQTITPESNCIVGQRVHEDSAGNKSWELVVLNIETGKTVSTCQEVPERYLSFGNIGVHGIDMDGSVYDIMKGKKCCQFDAHHTKRKSTLPPRLTADEKLALWVDSTESLVKLACLETQKIIGQVPTHSLVMNMEVTPKGIILIGCEDGRVMMLQITHGNQGESTNQRESYEETLKNVFKRSMKRGVQVRDSLLNTLRGGDKVSKATKKPANNTGSKTCALL